jgi:uncharacterized membrane protein
MPEAIRHREVSRLEGFSDAVFGFALTLLVVSLEAPKDIGELRRLVAGLVPFALMFAMVVWIWYEHNIFFRRYGLQDTWTVFLNAVLLFVVLFYVYPLKFLTISLVGPLFMAPEDVPHLSSDGSGWFVTLLYSAGVLAIFAAFALLHRHAWRQRAALELTPEEQLTLRFSTRAHLLSMSLAVVSVAMLIVLPQHPAFAGMLFGLMGPLHAWNGYKAHAAHDALRKPLAPAE